MRFSVVVSGGLRWDLVLTAARTADRLGMHGLWLSDHLMPNTADNSVSDAPMLECWTVLAAIAAVAPRLQLTSMVSPVTIHHPVVLAKRALTVNAINDGHATLGIGAGWQSNEHAAYGIPLPPLGERIAHLGEVAEVIHRLLHQDRTTFDGRWYTLADAPMEPKGQRGPTELLIGALAPRTMRITAQWADAWNGWGDAAAVRALVDDLHRICGDVARDPATLRLTCGATVELTSAANPESRIQPVFPGLIAGGANELVDKLGEYVGLGIDEFALSLQTRNSAFSSNLEMVEHIATEVLPALG